MSPTADSDSDTNQKNLQNLSCQSLVQTLDAKLFTDLKGHTFPEET